MTGIGIFGGEEDKDDLQISEKISQVTIDEDYVDQIAQVTEVKEFGKRKPGFRRKQIPKQQQQEQEQPQQGQQQEQGQQQKPQQRQQQQQQQQQQIEKQPLINGVT